jgi:hypothetical protein
VFAEEVKYEAVHHGNGCWSRSPNWWQREYAADFEGCEFRSMRTWQRIGSRKIVKAESQASAAVESEVEVAPLRIA